MPVLDPRFLELTRISRTRPLIMGVLNATPDSFFDGGLYLEPSRAVEHARQMLAQGADLLDLGGESTRPGSTAISADEELRRVLPIAELLWKELPGAAWSIDTTKAVVAQRALDLGACMVNDVSALASDAAMPALAAARGCGVVLMHRQAAPASSAWSTSEGSRYGAEGVCAVVKRALLDRVATLHQAHGLDKAQIWLDPGFGFGKSVQDNFALVKGLPDLVAAGYPVLLGVSRKSSLGAVLGGLPESERLEATEATVALAAWFGVACLRVHDVKEMARVLQVVQAVKNAGQ